VGLYLWLRPRKRDVFWDVEAVDTARNGRSEKVPPREKPPSESAEQDWGEWSVEALLKQAERHYKAEEFAAALRLYRRAGVGGEVRAAHYFRASLAAFQGGDVAQALDILRRAVARLPASEIKGAVWYNMGCFATRLGRFAEALRYLNRAVDAGYNNPNQYVRDPDLEPLRWHSGFKRLLAGIGG
jgi:tetratricopeptide (TPR) repeat protein